MSDYVRNQAHVTQGIDRLIERFKDKPYFAALLTILLQRVQHIDDVLWDLYTGMWLDNAVGSQLDALGWIVNESRANRGDDDYRLWIRARIKINRSNGQIADTLAVARLVIESVAGVSYTPEYPSAYRVDVTDTALTVDQLIALLAEVRPAGVGLTVVVSATLASTLVWDSSASAQYWDSGNWAADAAV